MVTGAIVTDRAAGAAYGFSAAGAASTFGQPIPRLYGRAWHTGVPIWTGRPTAQAIQSNLSGVIGSQTQQTCSFAVMFGEPAPGATETRVMRLRVNGKLVYDVTGTTAEAQLPNLDFTVYPGTMSQPVDPTIQAAEGDNATAFRGRLYIVFHEYPLGLSNAFPSIEADIASSATSVYRVTPFLTAAEAATLPTYHYQIIDWKRQRSLMLDQHTTIDVWDLRYNMRLFDNAVSGDTGNSSSWEYCSALSYQNRKPWLWAQRNTLSNSNPIYLMDYETGVILALIGDESSALTPQPTSRPHAFIMQAVAGIAGFDEILLCAATVSKHLYAIGVKAGTTQPQYLSLNAGASLTTDTGCLNTVNVITAMCSADVSLGNPLQTKYSPNDATSFSDWSIVPLSPDIQRGDLSVSYFAVSGKLYRLVMSDNASPVLVVLPRKTLWVVIDGVSIYKDYSTYNVTSTPGPTLVADLGSDYKIKLMWAGPAKLPRLYVIANKISTNEDYLFKYDTAWSKVSKTETDYIDNAGLPGYAASLISQVFQIGTEVHIPRVKVGVGDGSYAALTHKNPDSLTIGYISDDDATNETFITLDLESGQYVSTNIAATGTQIKNSEDGTLYTFHFQGCDVLNPVTSAVYFAQPTSRTCPNPGLIKLLGADENTLNLGDFLTELCETAGYLSSQITTSGLDSIFIKGGIINRSVKLLDVLSQVCDLFRVDIVQRGDSIAFIRHTRGTGLTIDATPVESSLVAVDASTENQVRLQRERDMAYQIPALLSVDYIDGDNANAIGTQTAKRTTFPAVTTKNTSSQTLSVPVVMSAGEALFWVTQALFDIWGGATVVSLRLPPAFMAIEPADIIKVTLANGQTYLMKVEQAILNNDFSISLKARTFAQYLDVTAVPTISSAPVQTLQIPYACEMLLFDNLLLSDQDNTDGTVVPYRYATQYSATIEKMTGSGFLAAMASTQSIVGICANALPALTDNTIFQKDASSLTVAFPYRATMFFASAANDAEWLSGAKAALVGSNGRWELIYWRNVMQGIGGSWIFDTFARGRRGTEVMRATHKAGDYFIPLDMLAYGLFSEPVANIGSEEIYRCVTGGLQSTDANNPILDLFAGAGPLKPLAPSNVHIAWGGADYTITWNRRDRIESANGTTELHDSNATVPLSEATEAYELVISNDAGTTIRRTITGLSTATYTYTGADATADGFSNPAVQMFVAVYQISAAVGRGFSGGGLINVE